MPAPDTHARGIAEAPSSASQDFNRHSNSSSAGSNMLSAESHATGAADTCQPVALQPNHNPRMDPHTTAWVNPLASGSLLNHSLSRSKSAAGLRRSVSLSKASVSGAEECRICLLSQNETEEPLIHPCGCTGTSSKAHYSCLQTWALEKRSLTCELCKQQYTEPYYSQLKVQLEQHIEQHPRIPSFLVAEGITAGAQHDSNEADEAGIDVSNFVCQVVVVLVLLGVILYLTVFSNIAPSLSSDWTSILWRVLTVLIPGYLIVRMLYGMYSRWVRMRRARQAQAAQQAAAATAASAEQQQHGNAADMDAVDGMRSAADASSEQQAGQEGQSQQQQQQQQPQDTSQQGTSDAQGRLQQQQRQSDDMPSNQCAARERLVTVVVVQPEVQQHAPDHDHGYGAQLQACGQDGAAAEQAKDHVAINIPATQNAA